MAVTEHWKSGDELPAYVIEGWKLVSYFCRPSGCHGGSAIYCRSNISCKQRTDLTSLSVIRCFECSAVEVQLGSSKYVIVCIYHPPTGNDELFFEKLYKLLIILTLEGKNYILAGDYNIDLLSQTKESRTFVSLIEGFDARFTLNKPTRITSTSSTCIDNIITNLESGETTIIPSHLSDHTAQKFSFRCSSERVVRGKKRMRLINDQTVADFLTSLATIDWCDVIDPGISADRQWDQFFAAYRAHFEQAFPVFWSRRSEGKSRNFNAESDELRELKNHLDILYTISHHKSEYMDLYKITKTKYETLLKKLKQEHFHKILNNSHNKPKKVWEIVNNMTGRDNKNHNQITTKNPQHLAEDFNDYFINVAKKLIQNSQTKKKFQPSENRGNVKSFFVFNVTDDEVINTVKRMKNKTSFGYDEIPMTVIKRSIHLIAKPLSEIIYACFTQGIFPESLKTSIVKPVYKKGDVNNIGNYRPISLLSAFSKIFEKILSVRLIKFLRKYNIFASNQHGFLKGKNTETAIFEMVDEIISKLENGNPSIGLFLDLSKAFDCVSHDLLLEKLFHCGIRDNQLELIRSFLRGRIQKVKIEMNGEDYFSADRIVEMGVPQGSILGPLLFLLYINDLPDCVQNCLLLMFVDDTNIIVSRKLLDDAVDDIKAEYKNFLKWCENNQIIVNSEKTECVLFTTHNSKLTFPDRVSLEGGGKMFQSSTNFLGVILDSHISWSSQVLNVRKRLNSVIYTMRVLSRRVDSSFLRVVYFANFQSLLQYGLMIWGNASDASDIFIVQKSAIRIMNNMKYRDSCRGVFRRNGILTLTGLYVKKCLLFFRQQSSYFEKFRNTNSTRKMIPFHFPQHSLTLTEKNVKYMCLKLYNSLPRKIQQIDNFKNFKREISNFLIETEPYNVQEYLDHCKCKGLV